MKQINITPEEEAEMICLRKEGWKIKQIAEYIGCNISTVSIHLHGEKRGGKRLSHNEHSRRYRERVKQDPEKAAKVREQTRIRVRRMREKRKQQPLKEAAE